ncbi:MAG TPA: hypothetical protein VFA89_20885 [Terriglobales bacterium]|nr:hypothetical protein [Terriglobales bacterium]
MSTILGYGQTSSSDTVGGHFPIIGDATAANGKKGILLQATTMNAGTSAALPATAAGWLPKLFARSVYTMVRDYWDSALSTPYSGQIFPTGAAKGTQAGQIFPD